MFLLENILAYFNSLSLSIDVMIQGDSFVLFFYKVIAFFSMAHKLVSIPIDDNEFYREVSIRQYLAEPNNTNIDIKNCELGVGYKVWKRHETCKNSYKDLLERRGRG